MYIILPYTLNGVDHVINEINPFFLMRDVWAMQELPLDVWIPKFKFEFTSHLENILRQVIVCSRQYRKSRMKYIRYYIQYYISIYIHRKYNNINLRLFTHHIFYYIKFVSAYNFDKDIIFILIIF